MITINGKTYTKEDVERIRQEMDEYRKECNNKTAQQGCSRCECDSKYWKNDKCIGCGTQHDPQRHDSEE